MGMFHRFLLTKIKRFALREKDKALEKILTLKSAMYLAREVCSLLVIVMPHS